MCKAILSRLMRVALMALVATTFVGLTGCDQGSENETAYDEFYDDVGELDYYRREVLYLKRMKAKKAAKQCARTHYDEIGEMSIDDPPRRKIVKKRRPTKQVKVSAYKAPVRRAISVPAPAAAPEYARQSSS